MFGVGRGRGRAEKRDNERATVIEERVQGMGKWREEKKRS